MIHDNEYLDDYSRYQADTPGGPCSPYGCSWVAGMMVVNPEDLDTVAGTRPVECQECERVYEPARAEEPGYLYPDDPQAPAEHTGAPRADDGWTGVAGLPWGGTG